MIETEVDNLKELKFRLNTILAFGFKYSSFFGKQSGLVAVYELLGDEVMSEGYKFKYGIESN